MRALMVAALLVVAPPAWATNWSIYFQPSFSTAQNANLRASFTVAGRFGTPRFATASLPTCDSNNEGAIATDSTLHTFQYCNGTGWVAGGFGGGTVGSATNFSAAVGFADGTVGAPSIAWTSDQDGTGTGWYRPAANQAAFSANGVQQVLLGTIIAVLGNGTAGVTSNNSGTFAVWNNGRLGWGSGAITATSAVDAFTTREGAAIIQQGSDVNGAPVTQVYKAHDGITGTDVSGAALQLKPGLGTGAGVSNPLTLSRVNTLATGTTAQTYGQSFVSCPTKILSNTSATAQTIATITTTTATGGGVAMTYTVTTSNGSLVNTEIGQSNTAWNNAAGTVAATMSAALNAINSNGSGTLTALPTATVATSVVSIKVTPTWTVMTPTVVTAYATFVVNSTDNVVCQ